MTESTSTISIALINDEGLLAMAIHKRLIRPTKLSINADADLFNHWWSNLVNVFRQCYIVPTILKPENSKYIIEEETEIVASLSLATINQINKAQLEAKEIESTRANFIKIRFRAAYTIMVGLLDAKLFSAIKHMHTSGDAYMLYMVLKNKFEPNTQATSFKAQQLLYTIQIKNGETISDLTNRIQGLSDEMDRFKPNKDNHKLLALFQAISLDTKYQDVIKSKLYTDPNFTFIEATNLLLNEEDIRKLNSNKLIPLNENANKAFKVNIDDNKYCHICKTDTHTTDECYRNTNNKNNRLNIISNNNNSNKNNKNKNYNKSYNNNSKPQDPQTKFANLVIYKNYAAKHEELNKDSSRLLFIDSGSNIHTCKDVELIYDVTSIKPIRVEVANGEYVNVNEVGKINLGPFGDNKISIILTNVAYSNKFSSNLISVSELAKDGYGCFLNENGAVISLPNSNGNKLEQVKIVPQLDGLYQIKQPIIKKAFIIYRTANDSISMLNQILLWHTRLGHINVQGLAKLFSSNAIYIPKNIKQAMITELNKIIKLECDFCALTKAHRVKFSIKSKQISATKVLERMHADIAGPIIIDNIPIESMDGNKYFSILIDEKSGMIFGKALKTKDETINHIKTEIIRLENLTNKKLKYFHSDGGGEYNSNELIDFFETKGVTKTTNTRNTPQHNGKAERVFRTIFECARAMLSHCKLPLFFWVDAVITVIYLLNRGLLKGDTGKTRHELFYGEKPYIHFLKTFGCNAFVLNQQDNITKLMNKSLKGIMIGYDIREKVYNIFIIDTFMVIRTRDVEFHEDKFTHVEEFNLKLLQYKNNIYNLNSDLMQLDYYERFREEHLTINELLLTSAQEEAARLLNQSRFTNNNEESKFVPRVQLEELENINDGGIETEDSSSDNKNE